ncbi:MAG: hypothetical protein HOI95_13270 [Chromatiales bacterium]|jgi:hypothetical protein|nr:hypothetical protein [Chromatiales bacterium]
MRRSIEILGVAFGLFLLADSAVALYGSGRHHVGVEEMRAGEPDGAAQAVREASLRPTTTSAPTESRSAAPAPAVVIPEQAASRKEDEEYGFDLCEDVEEDDPIRELVGFLLAPDRIYSKTIHAANGFYKPGYSSFNDLDASWSMVQAIPGWRQMDALFVYNSRGTIREVAGSQTADQIEQLRFPESSPHSLLIGVNLRGSDFDVAELTFSDCVAASTARLTWLSVDISRTAALSLATEPASLRDFDDRRAKPPGVFKEYIEDPLKFQILLGHMTKSILLLWTNPDRYLERLNESSD